MTQRIIKKVMLVDGSVRPSTKVRIRIAADDPVWRVVSCAYFDDETDVIVDWGDGSVESVFELMDVYHTYAEPGDYVVTLSDILTEIGFRKSSPTATDAYSRKVIGFRTTAEHLIRIAACAFSGSTALTGSVAFPNVETISGTGADQLPFVGCTELTEIHFAAKHATTIQRSSAYRTDPRLGAPAATVHFDL